MQWLKRGAMVAFGLMTVIYVTGCDVTGQVLDTIGLAWNVVDLWVR